MPLNRRASSQHIKKPPLILFISNSKPTCHLKNLNYLETSSHWQKPGTDPTLSFFPSSTLEAHSVSLFLGMTCPALCPAATCQQSSGQPRPTLDPTPADVPGWAPEREGAEQAVGAGGIEALVVIIFS